VPPIRIDHLITRLILGGAQENTVLTCEGLHADPRFDVRLITGPAIGPEGELLARARGEGYEVVVLDAMRRAIHPWRDLVSLWKLWRLFRRRAPDIVHTHSSKAGILGRIAARLAGVPVVIHTIHGLPFHEYQPAVARMFYRFLERRCAALTDRIICVGEAMKEKALAAKLGRPEDIDVVYSGIEIDQFSDGPSTIRAMHAFAVDDVVIGTVSRLAPLKGHADLLEAVKPLQEKDPKVRLLLVGDGELRQDVERAAPGIPPRHGHRRPSLAPRRAAPGRGPGAPVRPSGDRRGLRWRARSGDRGGDRITGAAGIGSGVDAGAGADARAA
jgi:glycosyltransferase involved in cell wall biosynthesis